MFLKINRLSNKRLRTNIFFWKSVWYIGFIIVSLLFFLALLSNIYISLFLVIASIPLIFILLTAQQEENYNKFLLELRMKKEK